MDKATIQAQLEAAQVAFWTAESKVRKARTEDSRQEWTMKRETLRPEYNRLLAEFAAICQEEGEKV